MEGDFRGREEKKRRDMKRILIPFYFCFTPEVGLDMPEARNYLDRTLLPVGVTKNTKLKY